MSRKRSWDNDQLIRAVRESFSIRQVIKKLGLIPAGGNYGQIHKYIKELELDTSHFKGRGWNKGMKGIGKPLIPLSDILVEHSHYQSFKLKKRLLKKEILEPKCQDCGWAKYSEDGRLPLELDHINGNGRDNRLENLRILCPNCHSLKKTHRRRKSALN